jgi:flagellar hook-associated protein 1 FlgK
VSGLYTSLNSAVKALSAQSRAIEVAGKNLANVNNTSYARQRVVFGDRGTVVTPEGAESLGLEALSVQQIRDTLLDRQVMREISLKASCEQEQQAYERAQAGLGVDLTSATDSSNGTSGGGIGSALSDFFNTFQSLASNPTDTAQRQTLIQKATTLTDSFNLTDSRLAQTQSDLDDQVSTDVASANQLLQQIANLNGMIGQAEITKAGSAVDLRDQRQAVLEKLAEILPIEVRDSNGSQVQVVLKDTSGSDVVLVDQATTQGTVAFNGTGITAGASAAGIALTGGSIAGALTARDGAVQTLRDNLDQLARQLVTSVNAAYGATGADFFDPAGLTAGAIRLAGTLTVGTLQAGIGAAGDNSVAAAVAGLANQEFSVAGGDAFDGTFSQFFANTVSDLGQALSSANTNVQDQTSIEQVVRSQRDGVSGVSLDEETADLMRYQRAYQASARVFTVVNDLLDLVVNRLGVS